MWGRPGNSFRLTRLVGIGTLAAALLANAPAAPAELRTVFTPQGAVEIECEFSHPEDTGGAPTVTVTPAAVPAQTAVDFVNFLVIVRTAGGEWKSGLACEYRLSSGAGGWKPCNLRVFSEALSGPPLESAAASLLSLTARNASQGKSVPSQAALAKAVASAMPGTAIYVDPPDYFLAGSAWAAGWHDLATPDGGVLSSAADGPYSVRIVLPGSITSADDRRPEVWVSFLVAVTADGSGEPSQHHHMGFGFAVPAQAAADAAAAPAEAGAVPSIPGEPSRFLCGARASPRDQATPVSLDLVLIPEGPFIMGSSDADRAALPSERPQHEVYLPAYYIARTPVTNYQFRQFTAATGYRAEGIWATYDGPGLDRYPVRGVSYGDAVAFCNWLGVRLPTEAEWEKAARGEFGQIYPWGNEFDHSKLAVGNLYEVGEFPAGASQYGILDAVGGVWEWTSSLLTPYPFGSQIQGNKFVLRGGCWLNDRKLLRCAVRWGEAPGAFTKATGFRVAMDAGPEGSPVVSLMETAPPPGVRF